MTDEKQRYELGSIATESRPVVMDTEEKDPEKAVISMEDAIVQIMNNTEKILKSIE